MLPVGDLEPERHTGAQAALDRFGPARSFGAVRQVAAPVDDEPAVLADFDPLTR